MTTPSAHPVNVAGDGSQVGVQALNAYIDTLTLPGDVQLTVGQDASPEAKYQVGVENLKSGNPRTARKLIWDAMMSNQSGNDVLFHWLVAMLSGRTVQQFSEEETDQLQLSRSRYAEAGSDAWADGVQLIYKLLDSVLPSAATGAEGEAAKTDMSLLVSQVENLAKEQRDMIRPHLELFLTGPLQDEAWRLELQRAQSGQHAGGRAGRAWMYFQPNPAEAVLSLPPSEKASTARWLAVRASAWLFAAAAGYLGWQLLWHGAFLGLLSYAAALAGGAVAVVNDLELRFLAERCRRKDELFRAPAQSAPSPPGDELTSRVDKLFSNYFNKYVPDKAERERWKAATAGFREFHRSEIIEICRSNGIPANEVAWLIRYQVRQLKQRWQNQALHEYQRELLPQPRTVAARRAGLAVLVLGGFCALVALRAHPLAEVAALASAFWAWRCWLRAGLERRRHAADSQEHAQRQAAIDEEFRRWSEKLQARPKDQDMAAWLECDRTVLVGMALAHFRLPRSRLVAHALVEEPGVAARRRARIEGGQLRYARYRFQLFLLAEDGVRQVKANLDFITGTLTIRERASHRYDAIASVRFLQETRRQTFELRLTTGELITIRVRDADPGEAQQDQDAGPTEETQEPAEAEEYTAPDVASMTNLLHMLERAIGEGRNSFRERDWARAWPGDDQPRREAVSRGNEDA
jgi:hypothetical protein